MILFLDSKDLISLFEKQDDQTIGLVTDFLSRNKHFITYSMNTVMEVSAPLNITHTNTNVMQILNRMTKAPHKFIAEASIEKLELEEAIRAFSKNDEFIDTNINPFVERFDQAISPFSTPSTSDYIKYDLSLTVFELWQEDPNLFKGYKSEECKLSQLMELDRNLKKDNFVVKDFSKTIKRNLDLFKIEYPREELNSLASWILEVNTRCPSIRLGYEVFHKVVKNITDKTESGDIPDFSHISCLPYVDFITLDRRMRGYVDQASKSIGVPYTNKVCRNYSEALNEIGYGQA